MLLDYIVIALEFAKGLVDTGIVTEKNSKYIIKKILESCNYRNLMSGKNQKKTQPFNAWCPINGYTYLNRPVRAYFRKTACVRYVQKKHFDKFRAIQR